MSAKGMRLTTEHLIWFYSVFVILFLSGAVWAVAHYFFPCSFEVEDCISLEPDLLKVHGAAAMVFLILFGTLIPLHIKRGWHAKMNRGNGAFLVAVTLVLILTGYGLYYGGSEGIRFLSHWIHLVIGILFPAFLALHIWLGRRDYMSIIERRRGIGRREEDSRPKEDEPT